MQIEVLSIEDAQWPDGTSYINLLPLSPEDMADADRLKKLVGEESARWLALAAFKGTVGETKRVPAGVAFGVGMPKGQGWRVWDRDPTVKLSRGVGHAIRAARAEGIAEVTLRVNTPDPSASLLPAYRAVAADYAFEGGVSPKKPEAEKPKRVERLHLVNGNAAAAEMGRVIGECRNAGRDLMNEPSSVLTTLQLVGRAGELCPDTEGRLLVPEDLKKEGFDLLLATAQASNQTRNPPMVRILEYRGAPDSNQWVVLVGKGVIHDWGGVNLKDDSSDMHMDMGGAATAIAVLRAAILLQLPINVRVIFFAVENAIGPEAVVSGTPVYSRLLDQTVVIVNTDAEGRLSLAECMAYAKRHWHTEESRILVGVDVATLTGLQAACWPGMTTTWATRHGLEWQFHKLGLTVGDRVAIGFADLGCWNDLKKAGGIHGFGNMGTRKVGSVSAGGSTLGFEFACQAVTDLPWLHLDMAGSMEHGADSGEFAQGGDVPNVITLVRFLQSLAEDPESWDLG